MWRGVLLFVLGVSFATPGLGGGFAPFAGPSPLAVLIQQDPLALVQGAETPRIAIYENGDVIYTRDFRIGKQPAYFYANLGFPAMSPVIAQLKTVIDLGELKSSYSATDSPRADGALFYLKVDGRETAIAVRGLNPNTEESAVRQARIPVELARLYDYLRTVECSESRPWRPPYIEVMIWGYDYARLPSIHWPTAWPTLQSDHAVRRREGYSIFLDASREHELKMLLAKKKEEAAVEIDGKKWAVAYRPVFPSEPVWRKALAKLE